MSKKQSPQECSLSGHLVNTASKDQLRNKYLSELDDGVIDYPLGYCGQPLQVDLNFTFYLVVCALGDDLDKVLKLLLEQFAATVGCSNQGCGKRYRRAQQIGGTFTWRYQNYSDITLLSLLANVHGVQQRVMAFELSSQVLDRHGKLKPGAETRIRENIESSVEEKKYVCGQTVGGAA